VLTVSELAARAGTPVSTIKFYVREKLLSPGNLDAPHRAFYDESHVRRLQLISVLRDVGELPLVRVKSLCRLLDRDAARDDVSKVISHVIDAIARRGPVRAATTADMRAARRQVLDMLAMNGIQVRSTARSVTELAGALVGLRKTLGPGVTADSFVPYLDAMCTLAERDFEANRHLVVDAASAAVGATFGTVLWEPVLILLRRIAHEHVGVKTFGQHRRV